MVILDKVSLFTAVQLITDFQYILLNSWLVVALLISNNNEKSS